MAIIGASNSLGGLAGSNAIARLLVVITGDSSGLSSAIGQAEGSLAGFSKNASSIGNTLTRTLTLPALALGGVAVKMASDFETAIGRVAGLTPILEESGLSIDGLRASLLEMASDPQVVAGPTDLADALYFAGSAGLSAANAMDVTALSAKAQSIGMGSAADVAKVLIFAMNNYASVGLTAASAMDVLTAAIREGTAEPDELAISLGRLLPIARQAGVSFEQVTAAVASLSNLGVPTRVATTSLRALFGELLTPTKQATSQLQLLGLTADDLRGALENGPVAAFQLLLNATHGNIDALHEILPQIRGFTAFLGLTDQQMERYKNTLDAVNNSQGTFQRALDEISKTPGFKFEKAIQSLKIAAIDLGEQLIPVFLKIVDVIKNMGDIFQNLPGWGQKGLAGLLVIAAAVGPILKLFGALTEVKEATLAVGAVGSTVVPTWKAVTTGFVAAGIAASVAYAGFQDLLGGSTSLVTIATTVIGSMLALKLAFSGVQAAANAGFLGVNSFSLALTGISGGTATLVIGALTAIGVAMALVIGDSHRLEDSAHNLNQTFLESGKAGDTFASAFQGLENTDAAAELSKVATQLGLINQQMNAINLAKFREGIGADLGTQLSQLADLTPRAAGLIDNLDQLGPIIQEGAAQGQDLNDALAGSGATVDTLLNDLGDLKQQLDVTDDPGAGQAIEDIEQLILAYNEAGSARDALVSSTSAQITASTQEQASVEQLAKQYGVSVPFMQSKLSEFGVTATGVLGENEAAFGEAAFGIEEFGDTTAAAAQEAKAATAEMAQSMSDELQGSLDLFKKFEKGFTGTAATLVDRAVKNSEQVVSQSRAALELAGRGVPAGLIQQVLADGPGVAEKLADATDGQLQRVVDAYQVALAATDAEILREAAHQKKKGTDMVGGFAAAIFGSKNLPVHAAQAIVNEVVRQFEAGKLSGKDLGLIKDFTLALGTAKGISQAKGAAAVRAFANALASGNFVTPKGKLMVQQLANAISQNANIPVGKAKDLVRRVGGAIDEGKSAVQQHGKQLGLSVAQGLGSQKGAAHAQGAALTNQFAQGILSGKGAAVAAAQEVANAVKDAMDTGMKNSPEYFTYYMGKKLIDDMHRGVRDADKNITHRPQIDIGTRNKGGDPNMARLAAVLEGAGGDVTIHVHGNVYSDDFDNRVRDAVNRSERPRARHKR